MPPASGISRGKVDVGQLEKQAVGVLLTAAVLSGKASDTRLDPTVDQGVQMRLSAIRRPNPNLYQHILDLRYK